MRGEDYTHKSKKQSQPPKALGALWKSGWIDCKSQRIRESAVRQFAMNA